jgi:penicillin amidase
VRIRSILSWLSLPIAGVLLYAGGRRVGPAPAIGPFVDPVHGVWGAGRDDASPRRETQELRGLGDSVRVVYDDRGVPHIFAATETDAYRALGYVVARDRLFQLEVQTRAAAGTLTELTGGSPGALRSDREARELGLPRAARRKLAAIDTADPGYAAMRAYADGVNAWIDAMPSSRLPIELRLLGARPTRWEPINSLHLLNRMGLTLSHTRHELTKLEARARIGAAAADALFPIVSPIQEPIQPAGGPRPRRVTRTIPPPGPPDSTAGAVADQFASRFPATFGRGRDVGDALGSNNWAVSPRRTARGHALLAGDPHLELTLPSIWYEVHLVVPAVMDVYGVTIPGAPAVIIGFNRDIAWSFTNTEADVLDWYAETVDDSVAPTRYRLDGEWVPLEVSIERYLDQRGEVVAVDTLRFTHRGPLSKLRGRQWMSFRWTALETSAETRSLVAGMRARSVNEWLDAMAVYQAPAQNMLVADRAGSIGIRSTGWFPLRPGDGRGDVVRDGSKRSSDWTGRWPLARYPQSVNPAQGFLASANQQPIDPLVDSTYLSADWFAPWRAVRINSLLRGDSAVTPETMQRWQTDPGSARADQFVPAILAAVRAKPGSPALTRAASLLAEWDRRYVLENERAVLFEYAMYELANLLWDEFRGSTLRQSVGARPSDAMIAILLDDPSNSWWDVRETPEVERRDDLLRRCLERALARLESQVGEQSSGKWRWGEIRKARIRHLAGIASLSPEPVSVPSGPSTLSPMSEEGRYGASWRMVVELGPEVRAWGIYPGGQSGDPVSPQSRERIARWAAGQLDSLRFPRTADELAAEATRGRLVLRPGR